MTNSPTYQLADDRIDGGLEAYVRKQREAGRSWRRIALSLRDDVRVDLTHETLRAWFIDRPWAQSTSRAPHAAVHPGRRGRTRRRPLEQLEQLPDK